jgi:hypothetical protein
MASSDMISPEALNSEKNGNSTVIFAAIFLVLQAICVGLRYVSRWIAKIPWGLDDALIMTSSIMQIGLAASTIGERVLFLFFLKIINKYLCLRFIDSIVNGGLGYHLLYLKYNALDRLIRWQKDLFALEVIYLISINLPKFALLNLYYRIFIERKTRICIWILFGVMIAYTLILTPLIFSICNPIAAQWGPTITGAKCMNLDALQTYSALPNIITDIVMLILPLSVVWNLHASTRLKIGLSLTFLVGSL